MDTSTDDRLQTNISSLSLQDNGTPQPVGEEFQVNTYTKSHQWFPSVAALTEGGFVITWSSDGQDGSGFGVYGQLYDGTGSPVGEEFQVNTYTNSQQEFPSVATLADGGFVVTWDSDGQDGSDFGVYGQLYDGTGTPVGEEFQVNSYTQNAQTRPSVTGLRDGGFVVTWSSYGQDGRSESYIEVYGQLYDGTATPVGEEFQVNTYTKSEQKDSSVAALADGGFLVTWSSEGQDGDTDGIYAQRYDALGNALGEEFQVNTDTDSYQENSSVAALADGGFVITWDSPLGDRRGIQAQLYDDSGNTVGEEFQVNTYTKTGVTSPSLTGLRDGGFVVTWISDGQDGSSYGVYGQRFSSELYDGLLAPYFLTLPENSDTTNRIKVANIITITDDILATSNITLSGSDVANFEVDGSELFLRAGTNLDFETKDSYSVTVEIDDSDEDTSPDITTDFTLSLSDNEPPTAIELLQTCWISLAGTSIAENSDTNNRLKLADVAISDDAFGPNNISLTGADADSFEVDGRELFLRAGTKLDFETKDSYSVTVEVDDPKEGTTPDLTTNFTLNVTNIDEVVALATPQPVGEEIQVKTSTDDSQRFEDLFVAALVDGGFVVTWTSAADWEDNRTEGQDGDRSGIYAQRYDALGNPVGGEFQVNTYTENDQEDSSVAALADGGFLVTWSSAPEWRDDPTEGQDGDGSGIYAQRYDSTGKPLGGEFLVNTYTDDNQDESSVAALADGGFVITWSSEGQDGDEWGIYGQRYDALGNAVGEEFQVNTYNTSYTSSYGGKGQPSVAALADGGFIITWTSPYEQKDKYYIDTSISIFAQRYDAVGNTVGEEFQVGPYGDVQSSVAGLADGGFIVSWTDWFMTIFPSGNYAQRYDALGNAVGAQIEIGDYDSSVVALADGGFLLTGRTRDPCEEGYSGNYAQRYDAFGNKVGGEFQVDTDTYSYQENSSVAALADGGFLATWISNDDIYAQRFSDELLLPSALSLVENTDTTNRIKVSDVNNPAFLGSSNISLSGADADSFEVDGNELFLRAGTDLDFETKNSYGVTVEIDYSELDANPDLTTDFTLNVITNEPPTAVALGSQINNIWENSDTTNRIKLANIVISDDGLGTNNISLSGADAASFEVDGTELFLRAGTNLDIETKDSYSVTVEVDDPEVGATPDATADFTLNLFEIDDPLFRFHHSNKPGLYLFAGHEESESIHDNYPEFVDEGEAFKVSSEGQDELMCFYRFRHRDNGGYLFAGEEESISVREDYPVFEEEGMAFYAFGADAGQGVDIFRFRNTELPGSYIFVAEAEKNNIEANYPNFVHEGVAFEAVM